MIRSLYYTGEGQMFMNLTSEQIAASLQQEDGLLWVDLLEETKENCTPLLLEIFGFHPLAVDDALEEVHVPKVDDWGEYVYIVLHAISYNEQIDEPLRTLELDLFLGKNYIVTHQTQSVPAVDRVWETCQRDERYLQKGASRLAYRLTDELATDYMLAVEGLDEAIDRIEDWIFEEPQTELLERIFTLKRSLLHLRRIILPQREVLNRLARGDYAVLGEDSRIFFRDVYDHMVRLHDITEGLRDLVSGALDTYLSIVSNRMNEVMKILAMITTLFLPLSFLSGFFGMNFFGPGTSFEDWMGGPLFTIVLGVMVLIPVGMYLWMRSRKWM